MDRFFKYFFVLSAFLSFDGFLLAGTRSDNLKSVSAAELYADFATALLNADRLAPSLLVSYIEMSKLECAGRGLENLDIIPLTAAIKKIEKKPTLSYCLLPVFYKLQKEMELEIKNAKSPISLNKPFNPLFLKTGWWNLKFFTQTRYSKSKIPPAEWLLRWVYLTEGLRRSFDEYLSFIGKQYVAPGALAKSLIGPMIRGYVSQSTRMSQLKVFVESSQCPTGLKVCTDLKMEIYDLYESILVARQENLEKLRGILVHPVAGTENDVTEKVRDAFKAAQFIKKFRSSNISSLDIARELILKESNSDIHVYANSLFDMRILPKNLSDAGSTSALQAGLLLASLDDIIVNPTENRTSARQWSSRKASLKKLKQILEQEIDESLSNLSQLIYQRSETEIPL
ncbi:MAG: hypothetical protein B7Y39_02140 [Bdellovibrio sp. 28-41-41]|nr:MAG: hypothetical protein B7Y39_02140 [Bdellovibrio sp. 28-41-41]